MLLVVSTLCLLLGVPIVPPISEQAPCHNGTDMIDTGQGDHPTLTPDYVAGPWLRLPEEFPFKQFTTRPHIGRSVAFIDAILSAIKRVEKESAIKRAESKQMENELLAQGKAAIEALNTAIVEASKRQAAFEKISPLQSQITHQVNQQLVPALDFVAHLHSAKAEIQLSVADKTQQLVSDLQNSMRSKEEIKCLMTPSLPKAVLNQTLAQLDEVISLIRSKLDTEYSAANALLNPIFAGISEKESSVAHTRSAISELQGELRRALIDSQGYIVNETSIHGITRIAEQSVVDAVTKAAQVQDDLLAATRAVFEEEIELGVHITSILTALVTDGNTPDLSANEPLPAMQPKANPDVWW